LFHAILTTDSDSYEKHQQRFGLLNGYAECFCDIKPIQGVPGEKVNILGGHSIRHSKQEKKMYMYTCPIPNGFRDRAISLYPSKIVDKKEILRTVSNTGIYCSSGKVGTV
jgi:hypothetical protein